MLAHLNGYERSDFQSFVQRQQAIKELQLLKLILEPKHLSSQEIKEEIYGVGQTKDFKRDAYNALRRQLTDRLIQWIVLDRLNSVTSPAGRIFGFAMTSQFLIERNGVESAKYLLHRAVELANDNRRYDILDMLYRLLIDNANLMAISAKEYIALAKINRKRYDQLNEIKNLTALQQEQNQKAKQQGIALDPENGITNIKKNIKLTKMDANDPCIMMHFTRLIRSAIVNGKDYTRFENFVSKVYNRLKKANLFGKGDQEYQIEFLYMHAHACYRNRKFFKASASCKEIENIVGARHLRLNAMYPRYMSLCAGIETYSGNNAEAIRMMEETIAGGPEHVEINEWLNMKLNLAVYYFQADQFRKSNRTLRTITENDEELFHLMGMEWCFKKKMIELIVQYELGNPELSLKMVSKLRSEYNEMLSHMMYQRAEIFLNHVEDMIHDPKSVITEAFREQVKASQLAWPQKKEDVQAITFFCWLKSKMENRRYYNVLLERLAEGMNAEER